MRKYLAIFALAALAGGGLMISANHPVQAAAPDGKAIFASKCSACHGAAGAGVPGAFPPLAKNPHVTGDAKDVIGTVLNGKSGELTVNGSKYNGAMPAWKGQLSNAEIAAVITYVRSAWGNKAKAVSEKDVASFK